MSGFGARFQLRLLPEAESEIREALAWYRERSPLAADVLRTEVFDKLDRLAHDADRWPLDDDGLRARRVSRFPYTLHYDLDGEVVTVLALAHHRRSPGYWRTRQE